MVEGLLIASGITIGVAVIGLFIVALIAIKKIDRLYQDLEDLTDLDDTEE